MPVFFVEAFVQMFLSHQGIVDILKALLGGGYGPGSYYTIIMLQVVLIAPVVYFVVKKFDFFGVVLWFIFTAI